MTRTGFIVVLFAIVVAGAIALRPSRRGPLGTVQPVTVAAGVSSAAPARRAAPALPAPTTPAADDDGAKLAVLDDILASKNDNDLRLDIAFRNLSPELKRRMRDRYRKMPREKLNERGTVVFLLGREMKTPEDAAFLGEVLGEAPCRGLSDCNQPETSDAEHAAVNATTLVYPQIVALRSVESYMRHSDRDPAVVPALKEALRKARASKSRHVSDYARRLSTP